MNKYLQYQEDDPSSFLVSAITGQTSSVSTEQWGVQMYEFRHFLLKSQTIGPVNFENKTFNPFCFVLIFNCLLDTLVIPCVYLWV